VNHEESVLSRSKKAKLLDQRIVENVAAQELDLTTWIFDRISVKTGHRILELCCGTGAQTLSLLELAGETGHVVALDISREALDTLTSKIDAKQLSRLTAVEANMDELAKSLDRLGLQPPYFDLIFCAYGLYYSADAQRVLEEGKLWLKPNGAIVIVGPFGPNNGPLFKLLRECEVDLPPLVTSSSQSFMYERVIPWATQNSESVAISTVVNRIRWTSPEKILNYWKSTTFYQAEKLTAVEYRVNKYFEKYPVFTNKKWIMMVEMTHVRP
jgi:ubiquinone/menaquinone biosynthesis C-methylase UbiE